MGGVKLAKSKLQHLPSYYLYGDNANDVDLDALNIEELRERSSQFDWIIRPHHHPKHIQLMLFTKGGAKTRIEGTVFKPQRGTLVVHPAGMVHEIHYHPNTEGMTITVAQSYVDTLSREAPELIEPLQEPGAYNLGEDAEKMISVFSDLLTENRVRSAGWKMAVRGRFLTVLVGLLRLQRQLEQPTKMRRGLQLAMGLRELVEEDFRREKHMAHYAGHLAISPQRLNAACQSALGCSASQVLHDRLMIEARRLLAYTEMTVAEIGHDLGFDDPAYFNRFFSVRAGQPPGAWRETNSATKRVEMRVSVE